MSILSNIIVFHRRYCHGYCQNSHIKMTLKQMGVISFIVQKIIVVFKR